MRLVDGFRVFFFSRHEVVFTSAEVDLENSFLVVTFIVMVYYKFHVSRSVISAVSWNVRQLLPFYTDNLTEK